MLHGAAALRGRARYKTESPLWCGHFLRPERCAVHNREKVPHPGRRFLTRRPQPFWRPQLQPFWP